MFIDFHTHIFPDSLAARAIARLSESSGTPAYCDGTAASLLSSMKRAGVDLSVVLPVATDPQKCARINDANMKNAQPGLVFFGAMHPDCPDWKAELDRIAALGFVGIKLHPVYQGVDFDDPRTLRILDRAGALHLTVVTHAGDDVGFPGTVRCSPEMIESALRQVGPVRLVAAHMGGWKTWDRVAQLAEFPTVVLDTAFSLGQIATRSDGRFGGKPLSLLSESDFLRLVQSFGADRILFGTDSPWGEQAETLARITSLPLPVQDKAAILGSNAAKLLHLPPAP